MDFADVYALRNETSARITGIAISGESGDSMPTVGATPLEAGYTGIASGESAIMWPVGLIVPHEGYVGSIGFKGDLPNVILFVRYLMFEDGSFYGYEEDFDEIKESLSYRADFLKAAESSGDVAAFFEKQKTEVFDLERSNRSSAAFHAISDSQDYLRSLFYFQSQQARPVDGAAFVQRHLAVATRYPSLRRVRIPYYEPKAELQRADTQEV
jgi:hypothetical protein